MKKSAMHSGYFGLRKKHSNVNNCRAFRLQSCIAHKISLGVKLAVVIKRFSIKDETRKTVVCSWYNFHERALITRRLPISYYFLSSFGSLKQ